MANDLDETLELLRSSRLLDRLKGRERWLALDQPDKVGRLEELPGDPSAPREARVDAIRLLQRQRLATADTVLALFSDAEATVRAAAAEALAEIDPPSFGARAEALIEDPSAWVRLVALKRCSGIKDRAALLRRGLLDPERQVRKAAVGEIGWLPSSGWAAPLAAAFRAAAGELDLEGAIAFALYCLRADPDFAVATAPLVPRLLQLAGDEDAYDPDNDIQTGLQAAQLVAVTGVPTALRPALDAALGREGLHHYVRKLLQQARTV